MSTLSDRLAALRTAMVQQDLAAWIINGTDPHSSEYVADRWTTREWISGFSGSAGSVIITADEALLFTDSRYFIQAEAELKESGFTLMKLHTPGYPDMVQYLNTTFSSGARVGIAKETLTISERDRYAKSLAASITLVPSEDLIDAIWRDRPLVPSTAVLEMAAELTGFSAEAKLAQVRAELAKKGASVTIISSLDDIAWLTNLRASDVVYNPVFYAYLIVGETQAWLCSNLSRYSEEIRSSLAEHFVLVPYEEVAEVIAKEISAEERVYLDFDRTTLVVEEALKSDNLVSGRDITTDLKAKKNPTELEGMRRAHLLDGVALVNFLAKLDTKAGSYTEIEISELLLAERKRNKEFLGESFHPISGFNANGALPHYRATEEHNSTVTGDGLLVLDTGGHYESGMTDVTRTILFGEATVQQKQDYTLVLKGNLALASARFPEGTFGYQLDVLARQFLWDAGLAFFHGTGHGIGFRLNVHEGPQSISPRAITVALEEGMIVSDEPGLYREGEHGIRIENIIVVQPDVTTDFGRFLSFEVLTICPFERTLIEKDLLSETEIAMVDAYHSWVYDELHELVDEAALPYLAAATAPL
ncbi:MAG TPA: aminopeptidase P family protein [Sphaerochaeta sp.]|nr:aminopeptidase P family protein [Sphaerochaeta sp.]